MLAAIAGVSLRTLQRRFKVRYGLTVSDWIKTVRMQEAVNRVRAGDRVKEVAFDLGYKQLSHFSREFKRKYGAPPTQLPTTSRKNRPARQSRQS
jgi:AraC-like DNA-binding protein